MYRGNVKSKCLCTLGDFVDFRTEKVIFPIVYKSCPFAEDKKICVEEKRGNVRRVGVCKCFPRLIEANLRILGEGGSVWIWF